MMLQNDIQRPKRQDGFLHGDIVYFVDNWIVRVGVFDEQMKDQGYAYVDLIELADHRYVDGVPIQDFHSETEWKTLPKDWTYSTDLVHLKEMIPDEVKNRRKELKWTDPRDVKTGLNEGILVLRRSVFHGVVEAEIDRHLGYRIVKRYPHWTQNYGNPYKDYCRVISDGLFPTYEEARDHLRMAEAKREKELAMSDEEWSWFEIRKVLRHVPQQYMERCLTFLNSLPDIWDVELKRSEGIIYWRYFEKKTPWERIL